jgi:hypothetical protein
MKYSNEVKHGTGRQRRVVRGECQTRYPCSVNHFPVCGTLTAPEGDTCRQVQELRATPGAGLVKEQAVKITRFIK